MRSVPDAKGPLQPPASRVLQLLEGWRCVRVLEPWKEDQSCQATVCRSELSSHHRSNTGPNHTEMTAE